MFWISALLGDPGCERYLCAVIFMGPVKVDLQVVGNVPYAEEKIKNCSTCQLVLCDLKK